MLYIKSLKLFKESLEFTIDDWFEMENNILQDVLNKIESKEKIYFRLINKNQYHTALKEFMQHGMFMRFPEKYIFQWKMLLLNNIAKLNVLTDLSGHGSSFPYDEFYDTFDNEDRDGEFSTWCNKKYKETNDENFLKDENWSSCSQFLEEVKNIDEYLPLFSNGQWVLSDYGLEPLFKLGRELIDTDSPEKIIVLINRVLDVTHQRSDLAELFIQGGSESLDYISNS